MSIETISDKQYRELPIVIEGESKEIRYTGEGEVLIRLKPTVYSFTHNRAGIVEGTDVARLRAIKSLLPVIQAAGIAHTYREVGEWLIRSQLVLQPFVHGEAEPFRPRDLSSQELDSLPKAPPVEVVVKAIHSGTPKHRYYRFSDYPLKSGKYVEPEHLYPRPFVRFDWRNPMHNEFGERLADEVLPDDMASWYLDVKSAKKTALTAFNALGTHLSSKNLELWDLCFFIAEDGKTMFGEVSPDGMRVRVKNGAALDKDLWRQGGSSDLVLQKWQSFAEILETE